MYDPSPKLEGRLLLRFCKSDLLDPVVRQVLNLGPLLEHTSDSSDGSSSSSNDDNEDIDIVEGTLLGNDSAVYHVHWVLTNETHVAAVVPYGCY